MQVIEISAKTKPLQLSSIRSRASNNSYFVVDADHPTLCSVNGCVYSKDMTILYAIAPCLKDIYIMPHSVIRVVSNVTSNIISKIVVSPNLQTISGISFLKEQILDLSGTCLNSCSDSITILIDNAIHKYITLPETVLNNCFGSSNSNYKITKHAIMSYIRGERDYNLVGTINLDEETKKNYIVPEEVTKIALLCCPVEPIENIHLGSNTSVFGQTFLKSNMIQRIIPSENHPELFCYENCLYRKIQDGFSLVWVPKDTTQLHILEGTTTIERYAGCNLQLNEIVFPTSLNIIEDGAFENCQISNNLDLQNTSVQKIGGYAFKELKAFDIRLPKCCAYLGRYCFYNASFNNINLQDTTLTSLCDYVFAFVKCNKIQTPSTVNHCWTHIFCNASIKEVDMSQVQLSSLRESFFEASEIEIIKLPKNIRHVLSYAFRSTTTKSITFNNDKGMTLTIHREAFCDSKISVIKAPTANSALERAFAGCTELTDLILSEHCTFKPSALNKCPKAIKDKFK